MAFLKKILFVLCTIVLVISNNMPSFFAVVMGKC